MRHAYNCHFIKGELLLLSDEHQAFKVVILVPCLTLNDWSFLKHGLIALDDKGGGGMRKENHLVWYWQGDWPMVTSAIVDLNKSRKSVWSHIHPLSVL